MFNRWQEDATVQLDLIRADIARTEARADTFEYMQDDLLIRQDRVERSSGRMSLDLATSHRD